MRASRSLYPLFALVTALTACCCASTPEKQARAAAEDFFRAIQVRDFGDAHDLLDPHEREFRSVDAFRDRVDEFRPLSGHTWVALDTTQCSEASCTFEGVFDPTGIRCEIEMTPAGEDWVVEWIEVDGERVVPWI
jgi:hypothetical protein